MNYIVSKQSISLDIYGPNSVSLSDEEFLFPSFLFFKFRSYFVQSIFLHSDYTNFKIRTKSNKMDCLVIDKIVITFILEVSLHMLRLKLTISPSN
jgi:hypothetical protein